MTGVIEKTKSEKAGSAVEAPGRAKRKVVRRNPLGLVAKALIIVIAFLVFYPLAMTVLGLFDAAAGNSSEIGLDSSIAEVIWNTIVVVGSSSLLALLAGGLLAVLNERTDGGFKGLGDFMPVAPLLLPAITGVLGWVVMLEPRVGLVNMLLRQLLELFGIHLAEGPIDIYSLGGLIAVTALHLTPIVYLVIAAALKNMDSALEEASHVFGVGTIRTIFKVTVPSIRQALASGWLMAVMNGMSLFTVPVIIGTAAGIEVLPVRIWRYLIDYPSKPQAALVLAAGMFVVLLGLRWVEKKIAPPDKQSTVGGKGSRESLMKLGPWKYVSKGLIVLYIAVSLALPVLGLLMVSLQPFWTPVIDWSQLTFNNYHFVLFENVVTFDALWNSLGMAIAGSTIVMAIGAFLMVYTHRRSSLRQRPQRAHTDGRQRYLLKQPIGDFGQNRGLVDFITTVPATIPHSLIGVSFILAFSRPPFDFYGTIVILLLAHIMMQLPYASNAAKSATSVIGPELGEASRICGASVQKTMFKITFPLILPGLAAGWVLVFVHILGEVTTMAMLSGSANPAVGSVLLDLWNQGNFPRATAFAIVIWLISSLLVFISLKLSGRQTARMRGN